MTTIARPYATAAFEYALEKKDLPAWESLLQSAATITADPAITELLASPQVTARQLTDLYCDLLASQLDVPKKHFMELLAQNERLAILPDILASFQASRAAQEKSIAVEVVSYSELPAPYQQKLIQALTKRLEHQVELHCTIDPSILGGIIVRAGDRVIDGSIRGKLARLNEFI